MSLMISPYKLNPYSSKGSSVIPPTITKYVEFGGTDEYLNYAAEFAYGNVLSVSFWAKSSPNTTCMALGTIYVNRRMVGFHVDNSFYFGNYGTYVSFSGITRDNTWKFYCVTRNGTSVTLYENNTLISTQTLSSNDGSYAQHIGRYAGNYSVASMAAICVYNKVLSSAERIALFGGGSPLTSGNAELITGLIHYFNFNQAYNGIKDIITDETLTQNNMEAEDIKTF